MTWLMRSSGAYPRFATYGPNVVRRVRPAASVSELTQPSVTKVASGGVCSATQRDAASSPAVSTCRFELAVQPDTRSGDGTLSANTAATAGDGQRRTSQAARTATATHIAWKYL